MTRIEIIVALLAQSTNKELSVMEAIEFYGKVADAILKDDEEKKIAMWSNE